MGLNKKRVHSLKEALDATGAKVSVISKVTPYLRFINDAEKILVSGGALYYENETSVPDNKIPDWFWDVWANVNEKGKAKVGGQDLERLRGVKAEKSAPAPTAASPTIEAAPVERKTTKRKAGKKRGRRRITPVPSTEANTSENVNDGITG